MNRKLSLTIGIVLFVLGVALIFNKQIMGFIVSHMSNQAIEQFDEQKAQNADDVSFDFGNVENISLQDVLKAQMNQGDVHSIGALSVPDVSLQLPILYGISNTNLAIGAGTLKKDMKMEQGNYALAGHNMNNDKTLFSPLTKAKKGMLMYTTDYKRVYTYKITKIFITEATDVQVIENQAKKRLLTLVTCNYDGSKRLIVQGEYVNARDFDSNAGDAFTIKK